jgi:starch synthase
VAAELWPFAFTGGLGYAVAELAQEQANQGADVAIVTPFYQSVAEKVGSIQGTSEPFRVHQGCADGMVRCLELQRPQRRGPRVIFVDHPPSFQRAALYGENGTDYPDNARRFAFLALGALEFARRTFADRPTVVHAHDWHASLVPVLLRKSRLSHMPDFRRMASVLTVHNAGYQGVFKRETLTDLDLPDSLWSSDEMEWYGQLNLLKGALKYSDVVATVSRTHATEVRSDVGGFGLQDVFRSLDDRLVGIRNGIDQHRWDPRTDPHLTASYGSRDLAGKRRCRRYLQVTSRLPARDDIPLFGMSARLVNQKGLDLILASRAVREGKAQFVFLGQGEPRYEKALQALAREQSRHVAVTTSFNDQAEHRLLAGADFLMMPSLYEPCGLTQMRAQRYGTLPVARRVGGLAETVIDGDTGFLFDDFTAEAFDGAMDRAISLFADPAALRRRIVRAMRSDFSWSTPLAEYDEVYNRAVAAR